MFKKALYALAILIVAVSCKNPADPKENPPEDSISVSKLLETLPAPDFTTPGKTSINQSSSSYSRVAVDSSTDKVIEAAAYPMMDYLAESYGTPSYLNKAVYKMVRYMQELGLRTDDDQIESTLATGTAITLGVWDFGTDTDIYVDEDQYYDMGKATITKSSDGYIVHWTLDLNVPDGSGGRLTGMEYMKLIMTVDEEAGEVTYYKAQFMIDMDALGLGVINGYNMEYDPINRITKVSFNYDFIRGQVTNEFDYNYCDVDADANGTITKMEFFNIHHGSTSANDSDRHSITVLKADLNYGVLVDYAEEASVLTDFRVQYSKGNGDLIKEIEEDLASSTTANYLGSDVKIMNFFPIKGMTNTSGFELHTNDLNNPTSWWLEKTGDTTFNAGDEDVTSDFRWKSYTQLIDKATDTWQDFFITVLASEDSAPTTPFSLDSTTATDLSTLKSEIDTFFNDKINGQYLTDPTDDVTFSPVSDFPTL